MKTVLMGDLHYPTLDPGETRALELRTLYYRALFRYAAAEKPDAAVFLGDLTNSGNLEDLAQVRELLEALGCPCFHILGNHDSHGCTKARFTAALGFERYRAETFGGVRMVFLDTTLEGRTDDWVGVLDPPQLRFLSRELEAAAADGLPVWVFAHHPPYGATVRSTSPRLHISPETDVWPLLERSPGGIWFNGHNHQHSISRQRGWLFVQTGDVLSHGDFRVLTAEGGALTIETRRMREALPDIHELAEKMKRFTILGNFDYAPGDFTWRGSVRGVPLSKEEAVQ